MNKKILGLLIIGITTFPLLSSAATNYCSSAGGEFVALPKCINQIYTISLGAAALLALLMMILGGYYRMTAAGNAEQASKGTEIIMSSLIGIVLLFVAFLLLNTINPDLVNLKVGNPKCIKNNLEIPVADESACKTQQGTWDLFYIPPTPTPTPPAPRQ